MALAAATAAEEAANEVDAAAKATLEAVEKARNAANKAKALATQAADAATLLIGEAGIDKAKANHDVDIAEDAESDARDAFHKAEDKAFDHAKGNAD
ncbi:MAG TPA: hypothetical protein VMQ65_07015 [Candidatus Limnocylindria bacterium]|nr:hypothetical protein [Candidatus Limnocylindria bacterium]